MKFLLSVTCGVEDVDAPREAVVDITKELAELLIKRRAAFQALVAYDNDAWEIYFWSSTCQFVGGRSDAEYREEAYVAESVLEQLGEEDYDLTGREWLVIPDGAQIRYVEARTECDQLIVAEKGVRFMAYPKHCDWEIRTGEIPWDEIEKALRAEEAEESDETELSEPDGPPHVLVTEPTQVWDITFEAEIEIVDLDQDNTEDVVKEFWAEYLDVNEVIPDLLDWGQTKDPTCVTKRRWRSYMRALTTAEDPKKWIADVRFGSAWICNLTQINAPIRRRLEAGYREGQFLAADPRYGFEIDGVKQCVGCLGPQDREGVTDQHALTEGEVFKCSKCGGNFVVPLEEDP